jgi:hypothetical protein
MRVVCIRIVGNLKLKRKNKDTRLIILAEFSLNCSPRQQRQKSLLVFVKPTKILRWIIRKRTDTSEHSTWERVLSIESTRRMVKRVSKVYN